VNQNTILFPMVALALWTMTVLSLIPFHRFRAVFRKQVTSEDFKFGESARVPGSVSIPNRNMMNLLELPVLFYVACLTQYVMRSADNLALTLAWTYVALRVIHSLVHLSYNKVQHRLVFFALSNFALIAIWAHLLIALVKT